MRKIKLMALLLAALMIVTAFAGCAGVKKEELDALDVRVQALEDLLNGQQKDLADIKSEIAGLDNKEVLDAIESIKTDLESQIKDVNTRVDDEIGKADTAAPAEVSAATKAEQQKALALIEVKRAEFSKASDEYSAEDYVKISEALGTATGAVGAATTVDAVKAAMTALDAELAKYMTYAMKAYDYYCKLLGNVNADAGDLVEEAKAFLKELRAIYDDADKIEVVGKINDKDDFDATNVKLSEYAYEVIYLVSEGSTEAKNQYMNIYSAVEDLCTLYTSTSKDATKYIPYIDEDGDVAIATLKTVKGYTTEAEELVEQINDELGENFVYCGKEDCTCNYCTFGGEDGLYTAYEKFVEAATLLGGDKLAKLVTNADAIVAAEEAYKLIEEAAAAYDKVTKLKAGKYADVFYYYTELVDKDLLKTVGANSKDVWAADEYEKVADLLADWVAEYELSEDNMLAIIAAKEGNTFFKTYKANAHLNGLLVKAFNDFKAIADKIADLNEVDAASIDMVLAYNEIEELFDEYIVLQEKSDDKELEEYAKIEITLDVDNFKTIVEEAELFEDFADERLDAAFKEDKTMVAFAEVNGLIDLFTFEADIDALDSDDVVYFDVDKNDKVTDNRDQGEIYEFLTVTYDAIKTIADTINTKIANLVKKVDEKKLANNEDFVVLEGKYIPLTVDYTSGDVEITAAKAIKEGYYVLYTDLYKKVADKEDYFKSFKDDEKEFVANANDWTIEAFKYFYPEFESMIDSADFVAAQKTMAERMNTLFTDALAIVDLVDAIDYVRTGATTKFYKDVNGNGKYDEKDEIVTIEAEDIKLVSLNDKAAVDAAWAKYDAWTKLGGTVKMKKFANVVIDDEVIDDVYYMEPLADPNEVDDAIKLAREFDRKVANLATAAANFVATVENVKKVDAYTAITVTLDNNTLNNDGSNGVRFFAYTKFTAATNDAAKDNDGTYSIVKKDAPWKIDANYKTDCYDSSTGNVGLAANALTKKALLEAVVAQYNAFVAANVEYLADAKNNYDDDEFDYYQVPEYAAYVAFDKAVADYAKYDLLAAKGALLATYKSDNTDEHFALRKQINSVTSLEELENVLCAYVAETSDAQAKSVATATIYDFDRLASVN